MALGLILFDGGLRTKLSTVRSVLAPAGLAGHRRRADHRGADRADGGVHARHHLDRSAPGRRA